MLAAGFDRVCRSILGNQLQELVDTCYKRKPSNGCFRSHLFDKRLSVPPKPPVGSTAIEQAGGNRLVSDILDVSIFPHGGHEKHDLACPNRAERRQFALR